MPKRKRGISGDLKRRRAILRRKAREAKETEVERNRRIRRQAERQRLNRALETPEKARQRKELQALRSRQNAAIRKRIKKAELKARIQEALVKKEKLCPLKCGQKKSLMKCISYNPPGSLMHGSSCSEAITSDITNQCVEPAKNSLGHPGVATTIPENENLNFDPELMALKSNVVPELHIEDEIVVEPMIFEGESLESTLLQKSNAVSDLHIDDELIVRNKELMICEDENVDSTMLQNLHGALQSSISDSLIAVNKELESFQCKKEPSSPSNSNDASEFNGLSSFCSKEPEVLQYKKEPSVESENILDKGSDTLLENPALTQPACQSSHQTPTVHIDLVIPHRPASSQMNSSMRNPSLNSYFNELQNSKKFELGARSSVVEKPLSPVIVIKQEITEAEFNSQPQHCLNPESPRCPDPKPRHCTEPERRLCYDPEPRRCYDPEQRRCYDPIPQRCSNSEAEFSSQLRHCLNPEPPRCPDPESQRCTEPERRFCYDPKSRRCYEPEPQRCRDSKLLHCSNSKCLKSISQLKTKVAGLEFQLQESLRMSGVMSLKVQDLLEDKRQLEYKLQKAESALEDKRQLEYKLRKAESEILCLKQRYKVPR